jgi:hypothetical protein
MWKISWHADWVGYVADRWESRLLTRVIVVGKLYGATWPSHGLSHGTPPVSKMDEVSRVEPPTSRWHVKDLAGLGLPTLPWCY